jgi:hypothetical protein
MQAIIKPAMPTGPTATMRQAEKTSQRHHRVVSLAPDFVDIYLRCSLNDPRPTRVRMVGWQHLLSFDPSRFVGAEVMACSAAC